jgi:hypothetical protein
VSLPGPSRLTNGSALKEAGSTDSSEPLEVLQNIVGSIRWYGSQRTGYDVSVAKPEICEHVAFESLSLEEFACSVMREGKATRRDLRSYTTQSAEECMCVFWYMIQLMLMHLL